jgi:hypothetical protein
MVEQATWTDDAMYAAKMPMAAMPAAPRFASRSRSPLLLDSPCILRDRAAG